MMLLFAAILFARLQPGAPRTAPPPVPDVVWMFEPPARGAILSSPCVTGERVYFGAVHDAGLMTSGAVYCLDRRTGKKVWSFDDDGAMKPMYSSPCVSDGRLYIGEGMHAHHVCKFYCLDAATGRKHWDFVTAGHIESSPCLAAGLVFFGAGDDGLYALDALTGQPRWHFQGPAHLDTNPVVVGDRLYVGGGISRVIRTPEFFCLDVAMGRVVWRRRTELPAWGSPVVAGTQVFFGLGNGHLTGGPDGTELPAGCLVCVEAASGEECWRYDVGDAVFSRPAVTDQYVYFGARDGSCRCLDRRDGRLCWRQDLGSPVVTTPALLDGRLYVVAFEGPVCCLDASGGERLWTFDLAAHTQTRPQLFSSPAVLTDPEQKSWRLYFGTELRTSVSSAAVLYCLGNSNPADNGPGR